MPVNATVGSGLVVLDKPAGWSSHQVVGRMRRIVGTRKVGHAGTLDPMATGVLIVGIGRATRLLGHLSRADKAYDATVRLGVGTVTDDAEGEVVSTAGAASLDDATVDAALAPLRGDIEQVPSAVSAVKIDGVRSYARVRAGEAVDLPARRVTVQRLEVISRRRGSVDGLPVLDLDIQVDCSTGTYIRAIARDLGAQLGVGGHLTALRRTRVGRFSLPEAQTIEQAAAEVHLLPMDSVAPRCFATLQMDAAQERAVRFGQRLEGVELPAPLTALVGADGTFLALYRSTPEGAAAEAVFTDPVSPPLP